MADKAEQPKTKAEKAETKVEPKIEVAPEPKPELKVEPQPEPKPEPAPKPVEPKPVEMKWSILILTQPSRAAFLAKLLGVLKPQVEGKKDIEISIRQFDRGLDIGSNRQRMVEDAKGEFVSFVDDDDLVSDAYVSTIYPLLDDTVQYIGFQLQMYQDGVKQVPTYHSLRYKEWSGDSKGWYRDISHVNPIRRELALMVPMRGGPGEDARWAAELRKKGVVKNEKYIDSVMYEYLCRSNKTDSRPTSSGPGPTWHEQQQSGSAKVPLQQATCPKCGSQCLTLAGGMRHCNSCGHRTEP